MTQSIAASWLITNDGAPLKNGGVTLNDNGEITEIFQIAEDEYEHPNTQFFNGYLTPGFVNAHTHLELSFFDGVFQPGGSMVAFLRQIDSLRIEINQSIIDKALHKAYETLRADGQIAYGDIANQADTAPFKAVEPFESVTFVELFGANNALAQKAYNEGQRILQKYKDAGVSTAYLSPHAPYTVSHKLLELLRPAIEENPIFSLHFAETAQEWEFMRTGRGAIDNLYRNIWKREVDIPSQEEYLALIDEMGRKGKLVLLVHCVRLQRDEMARIKANCPGASIVLCPASNLFMEGRLADIDGLRESGLRIAIGTDSLSSSPSLSILDQLKLINLQYPKIPLPELFRWATRNGAEALGMNHLGLMRKGIRTGLNLIEGPEVLNGSLKNAQCHAISDLRGFIRCP